jgi:hypothetical protein
MFEISTTRGGEGRRKKENHLGCQEDNASSDDVREVDAISELEKRRS